MSDHLSVFTCSYGTGGASSCCSLMIRRDASGGGCNGSPQNEHVRLRVCARLSRLDAMDVDEMVLEVLCAGLIASLEFGVGAVLHSDLCHGKQGEVCGVAKDEVGGRVEAALWNHAHADSNPASAPKYRLEFRLVSVARVVRKRRLWLPLDPKGLARSADARTTTTALTQGS